VGPLIQSPLGWSARQSHTMLALGRGCVETLAGVTSAFVRIVTVLQGRWRVGVLDATPEGNPTICTKTEITPEWRLLHPRTGMLLSSVGRFAKPVTFAVGLGWLLWGAAFFGYPDWDYGVSLLMAISTYLSAEWVVGTVMDRQYKLWPAAAVLAWWCVDGSYWAYWSLVRPEVMIREGQWAMSLCLFLLCGFIWRALRSVQVFHRRESLRLPIVRSRR